MLFLGSAANVLKKAASLPNHETRRFGKRIGRQIERDWLFAVQFHGAQLDSI
jgi:hypothetical protein